MHHVSLARVSRRVLSIFGLALLLLTGAPVASGQQVTAPGAQRARAIRTGELLAIPGVREFSGRLIARPWQLDALVDEGVSLDAARARRAAARRDLERYELLRFVPQTDESILFVPAGVLERDVVRALMATGNFEYVEPDWLLSPDGGQIPTQSSAGKLPGALERQPKVARCPDDPLFSQQWHHQNERIQSCLGWAVHTGTPKITIAVCDTGILTTHEDLGLHRVEGYNAVDQLWESEGGQIGPRYPHGTKVTGTAAANSDNGLGVAGVGWNLRHRMIRVSNLSTGNAFLTDIQHGVRTAAEAGDDIVNVSYAGVSSTSNKTNAAYVRSLGGILVWGAGNESGTLSFSDRDADVLLVVGATNPDETLASFSNKGRFVDLVAPGVGILTTDSGFDSDYAVVQGTSFASPMAAGLCALIWSARPTLTPADVERILKLGTEDLGAPGIDDVFGYGRINVARSLFTSGLAQPSADFTALPATGLSPLVVSFVDQSTGIPAARLWDFGDGLTSTEQNPTHTYTSLGAYTVSLTVSNKLGSDTALRTSFVLVDVIPPVADFSATPTSGLSPLVVSFTDTSTGGVPTIWAWDFGDGGTSTLQNPSHTYTASGSYSVSLTVTNPYGTDTYTRTAYILVDVIPPVAEFAGLPTSGVSPFVVDFTDLSTGGVATSWAWSFGHLGGTSALQNPSFTYTAAGSYTVSLTTSNTYGNDTETKFSYIQVGAGTALISNFVGTPLTGTAPLAVSFTDLSIGHIATWDWNFGDGATSTLQNPVHTYTTPGLYTVILQVGNALGDDDCLELEDYIDVQ